MRDDRPRTDAEWTALNVFHDLQLAHVRQNKADPTPTFSPPDQPSVPVHPPVSIDTNVTEKA